MTYVDFMIKQEDYTYENGKVISSSYHPFFVRCFDVTAWSVNSLKEGAEVRQGGIELLDDFYRVFSENMRDLGTPVYTRKFFREILMTFPENTRLVIIQLNGQPIGAAFLLGYKDKLEIPWASTLKRYNKFSPNMLLYWEVLKWAIDAGYKYFDFGRSSIDSLATADWA